MDKQIQKLKKLVDRFLYKSKEDILKEMGKPLKRSDNEIWFYRKYRWVIFTNEIIFIFQEHVVVDIMITQYILEIEYKNIYYYEGKDPEYKVIKLY